MRKSLFYVVLLVLASCGTSKEIKLPDSDIIGLASPIKMGEDSTVISIVEIVKDPLLIRALIIPKGFKMRRWPNQHVITLYHKNDSLSYFNTLKIITSNDTYHLLMKNSTLLKSLDECNHLEKSVVVNKTRDSIITVEFKENFLRVFALWENQLIVDQELSLSDTSFELIVPSKAKEFDKSQIRIWLVDQNGCLSETTVSLIENEIVVNN